MIRTAKQWGIRPSELGICSPEDDLAYMIAWTRAETHMAMWEQDEAERKAKHGKNRA